MFYLKLALRNIKQSWNVFAPFMLASVVLFVMMGSTNLLAVSNIAKEKVSIRGMLNLAMIVLTIFSLIMEIYSYRFLMRQRSSELGLYQVLGMKKGQLFLLSALEVFLTVVGVLGLGNVLSSIFAYFFYLIFVNLLHSTNFHFEIQPAGLIQTNLVFLVIFLLLILYAFWTILRHSGLQLFQSKRKGEREVRGNAVLALLGIICLGVGYGLSLTSSKIVALALVMRFFWAVLFVILGTYLFFMSFLGWYLKRRKKQTTYFYQPTHFISVSQMLYRLRQHAMGLANTTLLAIMAFVTIGVTSFIYVGLGNNVKQTFPKNTEVSVLATSEKAAVEELSKNYLEPLQLSGSAKKMISYLSLNLQVTIDEERAQISLSGPDNVDLTKTGYAYATSDQDLPDLGHAPISLKENEIGVYTPNRDPKAFKTLSIGEQTYQLVPIPQLNFPEAVTTYNTVVFVLPHGQVDQIATEIVNLQSDSSDTEVENLPMSYEIYLDLSRQDAQKIVDRIPSVANNGSKNYVNYVKHEETYRNSIFEVTGGFLFVGFLLSGVFLLGAVLITYYKQYSEGQEDQKTYQILQEVGMDKQGVKKTIRSQTILIFFLPIALAVLHFIMALPMLKQMMTLFGILDSQLIYVISFTTILVIIAFFYLVYKITSRIYLKLVER